jgi:hypothetical protein
MNKVFYINLEKKHEIKIYNSNALKSDLEFFNFNDPKKLSNYDFKVFLNFKDAENYLKKFNNCLKKLKLLSEISISEKKLPKMLLKRRYMPQAILGEKNQTYRHYDKKWPIGQLFCFYDQTYYLKVELISIDEISADEYKYNYKIAK